MTRELILKSMRVLFLRASALALCLMDGELVLTWKEGTWCKRIPTSWVQILMPLHDLGQINQPFWFSFL